MDLDLRPDVALTLATGLTLGLLLGLCWAWLYRWCWPRRKKRRKKRMDALLKDPPEHSTPLTFNEDQVRAFMDSVLAKLPNTATPPGPPWWEPFTSRKFLTLAVFFVAVLFKDKFGLTPDQLQDMLYGLISYHTVQGLVDTASTIKPKEPKK